MATFGYEWYDFSIRNFFQGINLEMMLWAIIFIIFFFILNAILKRNFKRQKKIGTLIAFIISTLAVFYMSKKIDILPAFYSTGIDASFIKPIVYVLSGILALFIIYKWGISSLFLLLGLILLISGIFGWAYQGILTIVLGIVFILIGLTIRKKIKGKHYKAVGKGIGKAGRGIKGIIKGNSPPPPPKKPSPPPKNSGPDPRDKIDLARRLGIKKLTEEYQKMLKEYEEGLKKAEYYYKESSRLGWTKTKEGKKAYKAWYRQYQRNIGLQKQAKITYERIEHLRKRLT